MPTNHSNAIHTQWRDLIENLNATADDRGNPFFQKTVSRLESLWAERVTNQKDNASAALLSALAQSLTVYSTSESVTKAFVQLLPEVLRVSQSPFGFLAEVRYSAPNKPYLYSHAVTDIYKPGFGLYDIVTDLQFHNLDTLNGAIMIGRRPVLTNDPPNDPRSGGLPFGHAGTGGVPRTALPRGRRSGRCHLARRSSGRLLGARSGIARAAMRDWRTDNRHPPQ